VDGDVGDILHILTDCLGRKVRQLGSISVEIDDKMLIEI
jgi:hypothetical protein